MLRSTWMWVFVGDVIRAHSLPGIRMWALPGKFCCWLKLQLYCIHICLFLHELGHIKKYSYQINAPPQPPCSLRGICQTHSPVTWHVQHLDSRFRRMSARAVICSFAPPGIEIDELNEKMMIIKCFRKNNPPLSTCRCWWLTCFCLFCDQFY